MNKWAQLVVGNTFAANLFVFDCFKVINRGRRRWILWVIQWSWGFIEYVFGCLLEDLYEMDTVLFLIWIINIVNSGLQILSNCLFKNTKWSCSFASSGDDFENVVLTKVWFNLLLINLLLNLFELLFEFFHRFILCFKFVKIKTYERLIHV